jgi:hypothetical protein
MHLALGKIALQMFLFFISGISLYASFQISKIYIASRLLKTEGKPDLLEKIVTYICAAAILIVVSGLVSRYGDNVDYNKMIALSIVLTIFSFLGLGEGYRESKKMVKENQ